MHVSKDAFIEDRKNTLILEKLESWLQLFTLQNGIVSLSPDK